MSIQLLKDLAFEPDGTMISIIATLPDNQTGEVIFIIKEDKYHTNKAGFHPSITIRNSIIETDDALGFLNMFMISDDKELIYDCWLNYNNKVDRQMIEMLCIQERIIFEFRDSKMKKSKQFMIDNDLAPYAIRYVEHSKAYSMWSDNDFDILVNSLNHKYPIYIELWNELEIT